MTAADPFAEFIERSSSETGRPGVSPHARASAHGADGDRGGKATSEELAATAAGESRRDLGSGAVPRRGRVRAQHHDPGTRKHIYSLGDTPWYATSFTRVQLYAQIENSMRASTEGMPSDSRARARIEEVADFFRFMQRRLPGLLEEWNAERRDGGVSGD